MKTATAFTTLSLLACLAPAHALHGHGGLHQRHGKHGGRNAHRRAVETKVVVTTVEEIVWVTVQPKEADPSPQVVVTVTSAQVVQEGGPGNAFVGGPNQQGATTTTSTPVVEAAEATSAPYSPVASPAVAGASGTSGASSATADAAGSIGTGTSSPGGSKMNVVGSVGNSGMQSASGKAIMKNNCDFSLFLVSTNPGDHPSEDGYTIPPGGSYTENMRYCDGCGGVSMKVYLKEGDDKLTQLEYTLVTALDQYNPTIALWYDISFVNCATKADGTMGSEGSVYTNPSSMPTDGSGCPGWNYGMSVSSDIQGSDKFSCDPKVYCPESIYFVDSYKNKMPPNVSEPTARSTDADLSASVTFEMCKTDYAYKSKRSNVLF